MSGTKREFVIGLLLGTFMALTQPVGAAHNSSVTGADYTHNHLRVGGKVPIYNPDPFHPECGDSNFHQRLWDATENPNNIPGGFTWDAYTDASLDYIGGTIFNGCQVGDYANMQFRFICDPTVSGGEPCVAYVGAIAWVMSQNVCHSNCSGPLSTRHYSRTFATVAYDTAEWWWAGTADPPTSPQKVDLWSNMEHEMGHLLGAGDFPETEVNCPEVNEPPYFRSTMCPLFSSSNDHLDNAQRNPDNLDDKTTINEGY
jgi:hypothetical protein